MSDNESLMALMITQHDENMEVARENVRLLELFTAEQRVSNVKTGMLDETLKKVLVAMKTLGDTSKGLLDELK